MNETARKRIADALCSRKTDVDLSDHSFEELTEELGVYYEELMVQNEELLRTQHELERLTQMYADLFDHAPVGYIIMNEEGTILRVNQTFCRLLDCEKNVLTDHKLSDFVAPECQNVLYFHYRELINRGKSPSCDLFLRKSGEDILVGVESVLVVENGERTIRSTISDLTLLNRKDQLLSEARAKLEKTMNVTSTYCSISLFDTGEYVDVNDAFCQKSGFAKSEIIGRTSIDINLLTKHHRDEFIAQIKQTGVIRDFETVITLKTGQKIDVLMSAEIVKINNTQYIYTNAIDITNQKLIDRVVRFVAECQWDRLSKGYFESLSAFLVETMQIDGVLISRLSKSKSDIESLFIYYDDIVHPNVCYPIKGTPSECIIAEGSYICIENVSKIFPEAVLANLLGVQGMAGQTLLNAKGEIIGVIAFLDKISIENPELVKSVLQIVANSISMEIERTESTMLLSKNELLYRNLFNNITQPLVLHRFLFDSKGQANDYVIKEYNDSFKTLVRKGDHELVGKRCDQLFTGITREWKDNLLKGLKNDGFYNFVYQLDDPFVYIEARAFLINNEEFAVSLSDLTKEKLKEKEISDSRGFLSAILNTIKDPVFVKNNNLELILVNDAYCDLMGKSMSEIFAEEDEPLFRSLERNRVNQKDKYLLQSNTSSSEQLLVQGRDKSDIYMNVKKSVYIDQNGFRFLVGILHDITESVVSDRLIRQNQAIQKSLLDVFPYMVWLKDVNGRLLAVNQAYVIQAGLDHEGQLLGKTDYDLWPSHHAAKYMADDQKVITARTNFKTEEVIKDGDSIKWHETYKAPLYDAKGEVIGVAGFARDISDYKSMLEELRNSELKLKSLLKMKDKLFSIIAHDLRSPFNSLLGFSEMLVKQLPEMTEVEVREISGFIHGSALQANRLLENLLNWARVQHGHIHFEPSLLNLSTIYTDVYGVLGEIARAKQIEMVCHKDFVGTVFADQNMLSVILRNLVSNALKFTPRGGTIMIACSQKETEVELSIEDNGIGMTSDMIEKLFKTDFEYIREGTENEAGTGLGLLLCAEFAHLHNGRIAVVSEVGKGSRFSFFLPRISDDNSPDRV